MSNTAHSLSPVQRWLVLGALLAVVIGAGYWWYTTLEWEEKEIDLGFSKEAKQNDFLAADIFLNKQGIYATTVKNLSLLDTHSWRNRKLGAQDTIIIINGYKTLTQERFDSLYEWVENGGTLVTSTQNPFIGTHTSETDLLLDYFSITPDPEKKDEDTRDLLERLADGFDDVDDERNTDDKNNFDENSSEQNPVEMSPAEEKSPEDKTINETPVDETLIDKNPIDKNSIDKSAAEKKSTDKKALDDKLNQQETANAAAKNKRHEYRCALKKVPTAITFSSEAKPLNFDFSRNSPFIYHAYAGNDEYGDDEADTGEAATDESDTFAAEEDEANDNQKGNYDERREHLLYFDVGAGSITITSDNTIWSNERIDCHDHAYGLWQLVNPEGRVWFLINQDAPSLAAIVWRNAGYGVLAALLALVLWLWATSVRFGPVLVIEQSGRRNLAEHIYASAMLLWRNQQHPQLLKLLRKEILEHLNEQQPSLAGTPEDQHLEFLHHITGIAQTDIKQALFANDLHHAQQFAAAIAHLQTMSKQLARHNY